MMDGTRTSYIHRSTYNLGKPCMICEESVEIEFYYDGYPPVICDKCREAVIHVRRELEKEKE